MEILAIFIAKLVSPFPIIVGIIGAFLSKSWWHIIITAMVAASISEFLLSSSQVTRSFNGFVFMIGVLAAAVWAALAFWIKKIRAK